MIKRPFTNSDYNKRLLKILEILFLLYNYKSKFHNIFVALFCCFENEFKKRCVLCRNFISIYKINRTLHGHLAARTCNILYLLVVIFLYFHTVFTCKDIFDKNM